MANEFKAKNGLIAPVITSTVTTGVAPIVVTSTTTCTNLNADYLDGIHASSFATTSFSNIAVSGQSNVVADGVSDTLTLVAGSGITITTNAATDNITITSTATGGATITNDTSTNNSFYPVCSLATSGTSSTIYTSNTKFYYNPSTGTTNSTSFNSLSDVNKKTNINTIENALEKVTQLRGVNFCWKDNNILSMGLIAQEIETVIPEVVETSSNGEKSVSYGNIVGLLIESIKDQQTQINQLKQIIDNMRSSSVA